MPITGVDLDKCISCKECVLDCPNGLYQEDENKKILFSDPKNSCLKCGHCISICPEDAIQYEGMGDPNKFEGIETPENIVSYETLYKLMQTIRSVRRYKKEGVPEDIIQKVIDAMFQAPTGANLRTENITIISDPEKKKLLSDAVIETLNNDKRYRPMFGGMFKRLEKRYNIPAYYDAPHIVVVSTSMATNLNYINIGNIITYGRLAAQSLGLGTCYIGWTPMAMETNPKIKRLARANGTVLCAFTLGYPDVKYHKAPPRPPKRVKQI